MIHDIPWWFLGLMALAWWFPQNVIHECSHALVYKILGYEITDLKPYPNRKRTHDDEGNPLKWYQGWSFARMWCEWPEDRPKEEKPSQAKRAVAVIAPVVSNTVLLLLVFLLLIVPINPWVQGVFFGLAVTNFADGTNNWRFIWRKDTGEWTSDVWRFHYKSGWSLKGLRVGSGFWIGLNLAALLLLLLIPGIA